MVMSMPTSLPASSSKCHGALVLPVPTMRCPRSMIVRSRLSGADCAAAFCPLSATIPAAPANTAPPMPSFKNSRRLEMSVILASVASSVVPARALRCASASDIPDTRPIFRTLEAIDMVGKRAPLRVVDQAAVTAAAIASATGRERGIDRVLKLLAYLNTCGRPGARRRTAQGARGAALDDLRDRPRPDRVRPARGQRRRQQGLFRPHDVPLWHQLLPRERPHAPRLGGGRCAVGADRRVQRTLHAEPEPAGHHPHPFRHAADAHQLGGRIADPDPLDCLRPAAAVAPHPDRRSAISSSRRIWFCRTAASSTSTTSRRSASPPAGRASSSPGG